jgi:putative intracellular protease/amidase
LLASVGGTDFTAYLKELCMHAQIVLFDGFDPLDVIAPYEVLTVLPRAPRRRLAQPRPRTRRPLTTRVPLVTYAEDFLAQRTGSALGPDATRVRNTLLDAGPAR